MIIDTIITFLPPDVSLQTAALLVATVLITSMITAAFGIGGGIGMLAVIANLLPPAVVIPVHGAVQFGNNLTRATIYSPHIVWRMWLWFAIGAIIGGAIGINLVVTMSQSALQLTLGVFVLYSVLVPQNLKIPFGKAGQFFGGIATTFATLFVGGTGPLVGALLPRHKMTRMEILGTHASLLSVQHGIKIVLFGIIGFAYLPWVWLLGFMFLVGIIGNLLGKAILQKVSERLFRRIFQIMLVLLALRLILAALIEMG